MASGNYKIQIFVTKDGECGIGADAMKSAKRRGKMIVQSEDVYGIQLAHRIAILDQFGHYWICTPTQAAKEALTGVWIKMVHMFGRDGVTHNARCAMGRAGVRI